MYLTSCLECGRPRLFLDYLQWAKCVLVQRGIPQQDLEANLESLLRVLSESLPPESAALLEEYVAKPAAHLPALPSHCDTYLVPTSPLAGLREEYLKLLLANQRHDAVRQLMQAAEDGLSIADSYLEILQPVQYEIGRLWQMNRITAAQEHYCTAVTQSAMAQFYPRLFASPRAGKRAIVASVGGDLHEIGGRMVADLLELDGWETMYLGANTPSAAIARMAADNGAQVVALSVTMTYHLNQLRQTIAAIRAQPQLPGARILVGGRPFAMETELWTDVGADAWAPDGRRAVAAANELIQRI